MHNTTRRQFAGTIVAGAAGAQAPAPARLKALDAAGAPIPVDELRRFHVCDLLLRPIPVEPKFAPGEIVFQAPDQPFRIALMLRVPGFGHVMVYADNRGQGYTAASLAKQYPLPLHEEFAADRLATVRRMFPATANRRVEKAAARLAQGRHFESLAESLWAGEELIVERARDAIARRGPRPGFLFGANAFGYAQHGKPYADRYQAVFNYATLPFYLSSVQRVYGKPDYSMAEKILSWLQATPILKKGHPLVYIHPSVNPDWLKNKPFNEVKRLCSEYARDTVLRFRGRMHAWDVINEAHDQNPLGFTSAQQIELTAAAARAAREADPTCFRIVNCCCTWSEYLTRKHEPGRESVYDYLCAVKEAGVDFECIGLQYYYSARDLVEIERSMETFKDFGKPIHITELGVPSSSAEIPNPWGMRPRYPWHGEQWTEATQADWVEQFYTIAYSKPWIQAVSWWDVVEPAFIPHGAFLREDLTPRESYHRLAALIARWRGAP